MNKAKRLRVVIGTLALIVLIALGAFWVIATTDQQNEILDWLFGRIKQTQLGAKEHNAQGSDLSSDSLHQIEWKSLPNEVVAWVEVPDTTIDEPIVQADPSSPDYYLYVDVFGEGGYGTPYIDSECSLEGPFTVIYGHHMDDGSVFADFARFSDPAYAKAHRTVYLHCREGNELIKLKVVAVDVLNAYDTLVQTEFNDEKAFTDYVSSCFAEKSDVLLEEPSHVEHLWAFATCSYETWNSRTVVYAVEDVQA